MNIDQELCIHVGGPHTHSCWVLPPSGIIPQRTWPCPGASVGRLHGDRKITMVITCSFQFTTAHLIIMSIQCL